MRIKMLKDVTPGDYGLKGQYGWAEHVFWRTDEEYDEAAIPEGLAEQMVANEDAEIVSDDALDTLIAKAHPDSILGLLGSIKKLSGEILRPAPQNPQTHADKGEKI